MQAPVDSRRFTKKSLCVRMRSSLTKRAPNMKTPGYRVRHSLLSTLIASIEQSLSLVRSNHRRIPLDASRSSSSVPQRRSSARFRRHCTDSQSESIAERVSHSRTSEHHSTRRTLTHHSHGRQVRRRSSSLLSFTASPSRIDCNAH